MNGKLSDANTDAGWRRLLEQGVYRQRLLFGVLLVASSCAGAAGAWCTRLVRRGARAGAKPVRCSVGFLLLFLACNDNTISSTLSHCDPFWRQPLNPFNSEHVPLMEAEQTRALMWKHMTAPAAPRGEPTGGGPVRKRGHTKYIWMKDEGT